MNEFFWYSMNYAILIVTNVYLGQSMVLGRENQTAKIQRHIKQSWTVFGTMSNILKNKNSNTSYEKSI